MGAADRIAATILEQGRIRAEGLQRIGEIQAREQASSGQIWAGALGTLGNTIANIPGDIAKYKLRDTENKLRTQELDQRQRMIQGEKDANWIYQGLMKPDANGVVNIDESTLPKLQAGMANAGVPLEIQERAINSLKGINQSNQQFRQQQLEHQVRVAQNVMSGVTPDHPLTPGTALATIKMMQANGAATAEDVNKFMAAMNQGHDPADLFNAVIKYGTQPQKQEFGELPAGATVYNKGTGQLGATAPPKPEAPKPFTNEVELRQDAATLDTSAETPTAWQSAEALRQMAADKEKPAANEPTVTIRTTDKNGRPIERVMTRSQALAEGQFPSQPRAAAGGGAPGTPQLTQDAIEDTATRYRILGTCAIPTRIEGPERVRVMNEAAKQQRALGQSAAQGIQKMAANKADAASLTKMQSMADAASASEAKALAQADLVGQLSSKVNRSQSPLWNDWLLSGKKKVFGDKDTTLLFNALDTFTSEYAKIINGSTGSVAGASDSATKKAEGLISAALNKGTLQATIDQMKWEMGQTIKGYGATIEHINDRLQTGAGGAPQAPAAAPPAAAPSAVPSYQDYLKAKGRK